MMIIPCRLRTLTVSSLLSEASCAAIQTPTTALAAASGVPVVAASTNGGVTSAGHLAQHIASRNAQRTPQNSSSILDSTRDRIPEAIHAGTAALATPRSAMALAAAMAMPLHSIGGSRCHSPFRSFAASAADPQRSGGGQEAAAEVVAAAEAARMVLGDPMSRLLASQGMPVGLSLRRRSPSDEGANADAEGSSRSSNGSCGNRGGVARPAPAVGVGDDEEGREGDIDLSRPPPAEPAYQMEAFSDMLQATAAAARRGGGSGDEGGGGSSFVAGVQRVGPSLEDSWGTTRESPADIARRIMESNLDAETGGGPASALGATALAADDGHVDDGDGDDELSSDLALSPSEQKYASLEAMSADIKKLDEVFEVLASVPWLDEDILAEKELKGVAQVGLLGTLEEVGFNIRHQLLRIWSGERGAELAAGPGLEFRDQAALLAILYHTQQIEDKHGAPPGASLPEKRPQQ